MELQEVLETKSDTRLEASMEEHWSGNASPESGSATQASSSTSAMSLGEAITRRAKQSPLTGTTSCLTRTANSSAVQGSSWLSEELSQACSPSTQQGTMTMDKDSVLPKQGGGSCCLQLEFQDSHLSPALPLLPANFAKTHSVFEDTTFHQSDLEFGALRGSPDVSFASVQFPMQLHLRETSNSELSWGQLASDHISLSQHSLTLNAASSEDASSCCSISEHTMSPASAKKEDTNFDHLHIGTGEEGEHKDTYSEKKDEEAQNFDKKEQTSINVNVQEKANPEGNTLNVTVPTQLSDVLEKVAEDVGNTISSAYKTSMSRPASRECKISQGSDPKESFTEMQQGDTLKEHGWQGLAMPTQDFFRTTNDKSVGYIQPLSVADSLPVPKEAEKSMQVFAEAELSNIADQPSCVPHQSHSIGVRHQMCCDIEEIEQSNPRIETENENSHMPKSSQSDAPAGTDSGRESTIIEVTVDTSKTEAQCSTGFSFEQGHAEREMFPSGNHAVVDGSFLRSLLQPVSQSTPEVFSQCLQTVVPFVPGKPSSVTSKVEVSLTSASKVQSSSSKQSFATVFNDHVEVFGQEDQKLNSATLQSSRKIQTLPSMSYMEKVGAWNTNQSSGGTYFDNLHRSGVIFPNKKKFDTVSDMSDHMIAHQGSTLKPPMVSRSSINNRSPRRNLAPCFSGNVVSVKEHPGGGNLLSRVLLKRSQSTEMASRDVQLSRGLQLKQNTSSGSNDVYADTLNSDGGPAKDPAPSLTGASRTDIPQRWTFQTVHTQKEPDSIYLQYGTESACSQEFRVDIVDGDAGSAAETQSPPHLLSRAIGLGTFSDVSSNQDPNSTLASSQDSFHCGQKMAASVGAVSSVVSLEVDNYAPYWTANPSTLPTTDELNIEERIPIYLHNLGINQSPSTILTPFVPNGPIREPEFSPTDLRTVRGSTGTPTKSMQPSEVNTPEKEFSKSSFLSLASSTCASLSMDSIQPKIFLSLPTASSTSLHTPLSQSSLQTAFHPKEDTSENPSQTILSHQHPENGQTILENTQPQSDVSLPTLIVKEPMEKLKPSNLLKTQDGGSRTDQLLTAQCFSIEKPSEEVLTDSLDHDRNSFVGTKTLQEIRKLLGRTESTASGKSSFNSSPASAWGSDSSVLCVESKLENFQGSSASFVGNPETSTSLLWEKSISEFLLPSEELRNDCSSKLLKSVKPLACGPLPSKSAASFMVKEENSTSLDGLAGQSAEPYPARSVRREPEGCSAGIPDKVTPVIFAVTDVNSSDTSSETQPQEVISHKTEPQEVISLQSFVNGPPATSLYESSTGRKLNLNSVSESGEAERAADSDSGSNVDSLAARVSSLLRNESPAAMTSSQASVVDNEEHQVQEWVKVSGKHCGLLELNAQDRQRIEEIKRELLLGARDHGKSQLSSETDCSTQLSSDTYQMKPTDQALRTMEQYSPLNSAMQQTLEARVQEIARREGLTLSGTSTRPIKSINLSSCCSSPTQSARRALSPLGFARLPTNVVLQTSTTEQPSESQESAVPEKGNGSVPHAGMTALMLQSCLSDYITAPEQCEADSVSEPEIKSRPLSSGMLDNLLSPDKKGKDSVDSSTLLAGTTHLSDFTQAAPFQLSSASYRQISRSFPDVGNSSPSLEPRASPLHVTSSVSVSSITSQTRKVLSQVHLSQSPQQQSGCPEEGGLGNSFQISSIPSNRQQGPLATNFSTGSASQYSVAENAQFHGPLSLEDHSHIVLSSCFPRSFSTQQHRGLVSKPLSLETEQEPVRKHYCQTAGTPVTVTTSGLRDGSWSTQPTGLSKTFTPSEKLPSETKGDVWFPCSAAMPVLLPYKPHGSHEVFYVPQTEAPLSPVRSNSTMESSHPGSDDAVPPKFSPEVLGSRDQEEDHSVTMKHTEGVYSKRQAGPRPHGGEDCIKEGRTFPTENSQNSRQCLHSLETTTMHSSLMSQAIANENPVYLAEPVSEYADCVNGRKSFPRQGPSVGGLSVIQSLEEEFAPLQGEVDYSLEDLEPCCRRTESARIDGFTEGRQHLYPGGRSSHQSNSNLDQWAREKSIHRQSSEWAHSATGMELSLLERLERLSHFIHSSSHVKERASLGHWNRRVVEPAELTDTRGFSTSQKTEDGIKRQKDELERTNWRQDGRQEESLSRKEEGKGTSWRREGNEAGRWPEHGKTSSKKRRSREQPIQQAWKEGDTQNSTQTGPFLNQHRYPAERDRSGARLGKMDAAVQTESTDTTGTVSMINVPRLVRAFGPQRVTSGLERLYTTINKQKETGEQRGRKASNKHRVPPTSERSSTDDFTVSPQSVLSTSSDSHPPYHGLQAKRYIKLVSKGIQAGKWLSLACVILNTCSLREQGTMVEHVFSVILLQGKQWHYTSFYPFLCSVPTSGVSWFIPTDDLKAKQKKENRPISVSGPGPVWFAPLTRAKPWREPLRERQVQDEPRSSRGRSHSHPDTDTTGIGKVPPTLVRVTLQEALELRRPDFISCSRERMKKLGLQAEERRLQAIFAQEREDLFNWPINKDPYNIPTGAGCCRPLLYTKRVIPKKEMYMRSKKMYCRLPEVQRRKEEERRRAEYHSYRLKAQLYKKKITNHVLGRKTPWQ
ncbi:hypothetical protein Z043-122366 [Arapaima gigas]